MNNEEIRAEEWLFLECKELEPSQTIPEGDPRIWSVAKHRYNFNRGIKIRAAKHFYKDAK